MLLPSFVALVLSSAFASVLAHSCTRDYTVQAGDICDSICHAQNVSLYQLIITNPQIDPECSNLMPGEALCLGIKGQDCKKVYQVQPNDTCDKVADAHGIHLSTLFHNNPQLNHDCTNLYIDEVVCVAHHRIDYPHHNGSTPVSTPSTALPAMSTDLPWCD